MQEEERSRFIQSNFLRSVSAKKFHIRLSLFLFVLCSVLFGSIFCSKNRRDSRVKRLRTREDAVFSGGTKNCLASKTQFFGGWKVKKIIWAKGHSIKLGTFNIVRDKRHFCPPKILPNITKYDDDGLTRTELSLFKY